VAVLPSVEPHLGAATINRKLSALAAFYQHQARHGVGVGELLTTWQLGNDCHNIDAWESEETFNTFGETRLGAGMAKAGVEVQPQVTFQPAHEVFTPKSVKTTSW